MKRSLFVTAAGLALGCISTPALAQDDSPDPSRYLCELIGECGDEPEQQVAEDGATSDEVNPLTPPAPRLRGGGGQIGVVWNVNQRNAGPRIRGPRTSNGLATPLRSGRSGTRARNQYINPIRPTVRGGAGRSDTRILFPNGSTALTAAALREVRNLAASLQAPALENRRVRIAGHTDQSGSYEANMLLSQARAEAVRDALRERGVAAERVEAVGYGPQRLLPGRRATSAAHRRVEVELLN